MQIFGLHLNPKTKEDYFFDSFAFSPGNSFEKKLGNLYVIGDLKNALPQNLRFLDNLAKAIKARYYNISSRAPEQALSESLKKANEFLHEEVKKDNVSWLGNLNTAVISIKDFNLIFAKTGDLKILLLRGGQVTDIGKNLDLQEIDPYPLKVFFNIVSGKLALGDTIYISSKDVYDFFLKEKVIDKIARTGSLDEKWLKETLPSSLLAKRGSEKISGICLLAFLNKETATQLPKEIMLQQEKSFSFSEIFSPLTKPFKKIKNKFSFLKNLSSKFKKGKKTKLKIPDLKKSQNKPKNKPKHSSILGIGLFKNNASTRKQIKLIIFLLGLLLFGFLIFR